MFTPTKATTRTYQTPSPLTGNTVTAHYQDERLWMVVNTETGETCANGPDTPMTNRDRGYMTWLADQMNNGDDRSTMTTAAR